MRKYRITLQHKFLYPVSLRAPGGRVLGNYRTLSHAVRVMDAHARGADCEHFLKGYCRCTLECAR